MPLITRFTRGLVAVLRRKQSDAELDEELRAYAEASIEETMRDGLTREQATRRTRLEMGSVEAVKDYTRDVGWDSTVETIWQDVRYAGRRLRKSPVFTATAVVTFALGVGLNTAVFSVVDALLLRPLPFPQSDRLVRVFEANAAAGRPRAGASPANFADWQRRTRSLDDLAAAGATSVTMTGAAQPESLVCMTVSRDFFTLVGASPDRGAIFAPADYESVANAKLGPLAVRTPARDDATIILSHELWDRQFGRDPHVVGKRVWLNGNPATVAGVMARGFRFVETPFGTADCWIPLVESEQRRYRQLIVVGRLKPGIEVRAAQTEMSGIASVLEREHPRDNAGWSVAVVPLQESIVASARPALLILFAAAFCVLLITCANLANLLLMRGLGRAREVATRVALGAGRARLMRQWMIESLLLSALGGCIALAIAHWTLHAVLATAPPNLPRIQQVAVDGRVFAFSAAVSIIAGLICGAVPALEVGGNAVADVLRSAGAVTGVPRRGWIRRTLVVFQIGAAIVLLVGTGLMLQTLRAVHALHLGFDPRNVLTFGVDLQTERYRGLPTMQAFSRELIARLQRIPGIEAAGVGSVPLLGGLEAEFRVSNRPDVIASTVDVPSPGYFRALRIGALYGRVFIDEDDRGHAPVAVVNRAFARVAWGSEDVVGRRLAADGSAEWMTVVGVVDDVRMPALETEAPPVVYIPYLQTSIATFGNYVVRTSGDPGDAMRLVREAVREQDPSLAVNRIATMEQRLARAVAPREFNLRLIGLFSLVSFLLALVGIYGLMSESVASRTTEIGVRIALGAQRGEIIALVVSRALAITAFGIVWGLATAAGVTRYVGSMLFGVTPLDPLTFAIVPALFATVAVIASYLPAHRASRVDPLIALRSE